MEETVLDSNLERLAAKHDDEDNGIFDNNGSTINHENLEKCGIVGEVMEDNEVAIIRNINSKVDCDEVEVEDSEGKEKNDTCHDVEGEERSQTVDVLTVKTVSNELQSIKLLENNKQVNNEAKQMRDETDAEMTSSTAEGVEELNSIHDCMPGSDEVHANANANLLGIKAELNTNEMINSNSEDDSLHHSSNFEGVSLR